MLRPSYFLTERKFRIAPKRTASVSINKSVSALTRTDNPKVDKIRLVIRIKSPTSVPAIIETKTGSDCFTG